MGKTNLNQTNPLVRVLQDEHEAAKLARFKLCKYLLYTGLANIVVSTTSYIVCGRYIYSAIHALIILIIFFYFIRDTIKRMNLKQIGGVVFENSSFSKYSNTEEVYDATRIVCRMIGFCDGRRSSANMIHLITFIDVIYTIIDFIL